MCKRWHLPNLAKMNREYNKVNVCLRQNDVMGCNQLFLWRREFKLKCIVIKTDQFTLKYKCASFWTGPEAAAQRWHSSKLHHPESLHSAHHHTGATSQHQGTHWISALSLWPAVWFLRFMNRFISFRKCYKRILFHTVHKHVCHMVYRLSARLNNLYIPSCRSLNNSCNLSLGARCPVT